MKTLKSVLFISIIFISFSNCDFLSMEREETIEDLTYELTSSEMAVSSDEATRQSKDEKVKSKFLCQQACNDNIPEAYNVCFDQFKECKQNGQQKCGKVFRECAKEANVTLADWDGFKTCKQECREKMTVCKDPFTECMSGCNDDEACTDGCKQDKIACFNAELCPTYDVFCDVELDCQNSN